MVFSVPMDWYF